MFHRPQHGSRPRRQLSSLLNRLRTKGFVTDPILQLLNTTKSNQTSTLAEYEQEQMDQVVKITHRCQQILTRILGATRYEKIFFRYASQEQKSVLHSNHYIITSSWFKQMLFSATINDHERFLVQSLNTSQKINYARQYAQLLTNLNCVRYEQDLWRTFLDSSIRSSIWTTRTAITAEMAIENNLDQCLLITSRTNMKKRQTKLNAQAMKMQQILNDFIQQQEYAHGFDLDWSRLTRLITIVVDEELHALRTYYERRKTLFDYATYDCVLVRSFHNLQPTKDQLCSTRFIWQTTMHQLKLQGQLATLKRKGNIQDSMQSTDNGPSLREMEEAIEHHGTVIHQEKNKLSLPVSSQLDRLIRTIEERQINMQFCAQLYDQILHKDVPIFFSTSSSSD